MILDLDDNRISSYALEMEESTEEIISIHVECADSYRLSCENADDIEVYGRKGSTGGWTDLLSGSLDLSADAGLIIPYQIKIISTTVLGRKQVRIAVTT